MLESVIGNYRIAHELSEGGMSRVYVGTTIAQTEFLPAGYRVVLKVMSEELSNEAIARKRFVKEAQILAKLRHRFITRFYEFIAREKGPVLVMEFVEGVPVDRLVRERGAMPVAEAIAIAQCLLEALVYAHGKGIVHRDIKPANLILQPAGTAKVTDFGIAKMKESAAGTNQTVLTKSGFLLGTPHYMSPEQIREPNLAGPKSDVYSAGVVLYEMLTASLPFTSKSLPKLIDSIYRGEKPSPRLLRPQLDREIEAIVMKAMAADPEERFETARGFFEALEEYNIRPIPVASQIRTDELRPVQTPPREEPPLKWSLHREGGETHAIDAKTLLVGRDRGCEIVLTHPAVSRRHARLTLEANSFIVEDLKSANGTYVNDTRIEAATVRHGDVVRFGADATCSFVVRCRSEHAS